MCATEYVCVCLCLIVMCIRLLQCTLHYNHFSSFDVLRFFHLAWVSFFRVVNAILSKLFVTWMHRWSKVTFRYECGRHSVEFGRRKFVCIQTGIHLRNNKNHHHQYTICKGWLTENAFYRDFHSFSTNRFLCTLIYWISIALYVSLGSNEPTFIIYSTSMKQYGDYEL